MGNPFFHFKQFSIRQDQCAMKVGIDAVLFGAWTEPPASGKALDVGCGTGLLALMIAQKNPALEIDALEVDEAAARQAAENAQQSPWAKNIHVLCEDFFRWQPPHSYEQVICNPPFFNQGPPTKSHARDIARSERCFPLDDFIQKSAQMLTSTGTLAVLLPYEKAEYAICTAERNKLQLARLMRVRPKPEKAFHRVFLQFSTRPTTATEEELVIEIAGRHQYSQEYISLTKDYYLKF